MPLALITARTFLFLKKSASATSRRFSAIGLLSSIIWAFLGSSSLAAPPFVQGAYAVPQGTITIPVTVKFPAAQSAGNLNVVIVGWNDTSAQVSSVVDSNNNSYLLAVGPTLLSGWVSQSIYYAKNIVAGPNTVTVTFNGSVNAPDVR